MLQNAVLGDVPQLLVVPLAAYLVLVEVFMALEYILIKKFLECYTEGRGLTISLKVRTVGR